MAQTKYEVMTEDQQKQILHARILDAEQQLFNARINTEVENALAEARGDDRAEPAFTEVDVAEARLTKLRELRDSMFGGGKAKD